MYLINDMINMPLNERCCPVKRQLNCRPEASGSKSRRVATMITLFYGSSCCEWVHPLQAGIFRCKVCTSRRKGFPIVSPVLLYPRHLWEIVSTHFLILQMYRRIARTYMKVRKYPANQEYMDIALTPVEAGSGQDLEMFQYTGWPTRKLTPRYFHIFNNRTVTII